jgi:hypothetical protein
MWVLFIIFTLINKYVTHSFNMGKHATCFNSLFVDKTATTISLASILFLVRVQVHKISWRQWLTASSLLQTNLFLPFSILLLLFNYICYRQLIFDKETNVFTLSSNITTTWTAMPCSEEVVWMIVYSNFQDILGQAVDSEMWIFFFLTRVGDSYKLFLK